MFDSSHTRGDPVDVPAEPVDARLARVRAADDRRRDAPLLGAAGPRVSRAGRAGRRAWSCSTSSCSRRAPVPTIPPPDVKEPPDDAKQHGQRARLQGAAGRASARASRRLRRASPCTTPAGRPTERCSTAPSAAGTPTTFRLDDVIPGWTEGVPLMVEGERTRFWIPQDLAYKGEAGAPARHARVRHRADPNRTITPCHASHRDTEAQRPSRFRALCLCGSWLVTELTPRAMYGYL